MEGMGRLQVSDLFIEVSVPPLAAGVVETLNCAIILSTTICVWTLRMPYYFYKVFFFMCTFKLFCRYTLHVCNVFKRCLLVTVGFNSI